MFSIKAHTIRVCLGLVALGAGGAMALLGSGCTVSSASLCDALCDCEGCSEKQRTECIDDLDDTEKRAGEDGCGDQFGELKSCLADQLQCDGDDLTVDGCDAEEKKLSRCQGGKCQEATDRIVAKFEACGVQVTSNGSGTTAECTASAGALAECQAGCIDAASCSLLNPDESNPPTAEESQSFSDCINFCSN